jgi:hypothetical protein
MSKHPVIPSTFTIKKSSHVSSSLAFCVLISVASVHYSSMHRKSISSQRNTIISFHPDNHQVMVFRLSDNGKLTKQTFEFFGFDGKSDRNDFVVPQIDGMMKPRIETEGGLWSSLFHETPQTVPMEHFLNVISARTSLKSVT